MKFGLKDIARTIREIRSLETRTITISGSSQARAVFDNFTRRHPVYRIIPHKSLGVALIDLPARFEDFLKGPRMMDMRNKRNRALRTGHTFGPVSGPDRRDEILAINRSAETRDGRDMPSDYTDARKVDAYLAGDPELYGVSDGEGHLEAYIHVLHLGEICVISRLLGHKLHLQDGIMYLLISELVKELTVHHPGTRYLMYDTFFGASPGYRYFKERSGFTPYRVKWLWAPGAGSASTGSPSGVHTQVTE